MSLDATDVSGAATPKTVALPERPRPSALVIGLAIGGLVFTVLTARRIGFSLDGLIENLQRPNPVFEGLLHTAWGEMFSPRSRAYFVETLQMATLATVAGVAVSLPMALWSTEVGNPYLVPRVILRSINNVIRSIPDLVWAGLFVLGVGIGALSGVLALFFFSLAVMVKLTADTLDGIDMGPIEAANASGATHTQMLRTAVIPQILPAFSSYALYDYELNLRASAVLGLVGAGGIGERIDFFRNRGLWDQLWGLVVMFFIVVFVVERISVSIRRRLV
ncbi:phosphonate ABC transporter, permease protein PhnE [Ilumatobacter coccineus]|uniref:Phosphonate ABC transporter permease protein n=1 Tax=Ilumatobacter coccineus (strain NBRC 103263 / KCTC 29153 / YM16-304) TaxID=1313172 RepID=A0A6C7E819_ILUCY|nr:phosphonate ABC transporter, permease protein PhnE [Ilumatobacter coccineus]BAN03804.1 phosphonate ABC transporter permease protein [Ilumatobacter coccineus YM16-304]